ncbi:hypothetical protein K8R61_02100 [bacterium]|nr:hypothetical protein [bacterium]
MKKIFSRSLKFIGAWIEFLIFTTILIISSFQSLIYPDKKTLRNKLDI